MVFAAVAAYLLTRSPEGCRGICRALKLYAPKQRNLGLTPADSGNHVRGVLVEEGTELSLKHSVRIA